MQSEDFDVVREIELLRADRPGVGALVNFTGICRDDNGALATLELEHYPGMAEKAIKDIASSAIDRFGLMGLTVLHRFGRIQVGHNIVLVVASSAHRQAAFDGANFVMDYLKTSAPFWKREFSRDGVAGQWVEARQADDSAKSRWQ